MLGKQRIERPKHLKFIRELPCCVTHRNVVEAAHLRMGSLAWGKHNPGMQKKPHDFWCLPLAPSEHRKQHSMSESLYWQQAEINPFLLCAMLWLHTGDHDTCTTLIYEAKGKGLDLT